MKSILLLSRSLLLSKRPAAMALVLIGAFLLLAFPNIALACPTCVHFTTCATNTGNNGTVAIPAGAPVIHTTGIFTPAAGDEFAVLRPSDPLCAGAIVWSDPSSGLQDLTVWGDNGQTSEIDGMVPGDPGEVMRWVVWDASTDTTWDAIVEYDTTPPLWPNGEYGAGRFYALTVLAPTAVTLSQFTATSPNLGLPTLLLVLILAVTLALVTGWTIRRNRAIS